MATFADDALVNDAHREFWDADAIRAWVAKEMVGDHVTLDPVEVLGHHGMTIVRARYDGDYPKDNLPIRRSCPTTSSSPMTGPSPCS